MKWTNSFHAHHSPMGAHSSFTVGMFGAQGGMALEKGAPAESGVFVGYKTASGVIHYLPFFKDIASDAERYSLSGEGAQRGTVVFGEQDVSRAYNWATDRFEAPGISFEIITPFFPIPNPATASKEDLKFASCPATFLRLEVENNSGEDWEGFFALQNEKFWSPISCGDRRGFMSRERMGFATRHEVETFSDFSVERALKRGHTTPHFLLGPIAGVNFKVPAGETRRVELVLGY